MLKVFEAVELMIRMHGTAPKKEKRIRKYQGDMPFSIHPMRVLRKVYTYLREWESAAPYIPFAETMLVTTPLHDITEDVDYPLERILDQFGKDVRDGVWWLTNPSKGSKLKRAARKQMDREHLAKCPPQFQIIKMFDRIDNLFDLINAPHKFVLEVYIPESRELEKVLRAADPVLGDKLIGAADWLEAVTKGNLTAPCPNFPVHNPDKPTRRLET